MYMRLLASLLVVLTTFAISLPAQTSAPSQSRNAAQTQSQAPAQNPGQVPALPEARQKLGAGTDPTARISREVMHELLMNPYYSVFDNLAYSVQGNTVTLTGQVVNPTVKSDAEASVKHIEGVEQVVDNIQVLPPAPSDDRIRREEYRAIYSYDGLSRYSWGAVPSIHIVVNNGHVTLVGIVDNQSDRNMAEIQAKSVPGVFSVTNQLQVASQTQK